eukprot:gene11285-8019_t
MMRLKKPAAAAPAAAAATTSGDGSAPPADSATAPASSSDAPSAEDASATAATPSAGGSISLLGVGGAAIKSGEERRGGRKRTPGEIRIQKDIAELDAGNAAKVDFPNPNDLTNFAVTVRPDTGYWAGARYIFNFHIHPEYPHKPPKVLCQTKIYHPNIDLEGNVCLNILKEDWKPVLDINAVIYGLVYLFYEPNPDDPLNREAAELFRNDRNQFQRIVRRTLEGYGHAGVSFERFV